MARSWLDKARKSGQQLGPAASDGTFAAGVNHVTELLPSFMTDIIAAAPEDQKVRYLETAHEARSLYSIHGISQACVTLSAFSVSSAKAREKRDDRADANAHAVFRVMCCAPNINSRIFRKLGKDPEVDQHLGAWKHVPGANAIGLQRQAKRSLRKW